MRRRKYQSVAFFFKREGYIPEMKIFPYEKFRIKCCKSNDEILQILENNIEPARLLRFGRGIKFFEGHFDEKKFKIHRIINYRNSFIPVIKGRIDYRADRTDVTVTMSMHLLVEVFMAVWLSGVFMGCLMSIRDLTGENDSSVWLFRLLIFFMLFFGFALMNIPFRIEAKKARKKLFEMFGDEE